MQSAISYFLILVSFFIVSACTETLVDAPSLNKRAFELSLEEMRAQASSGISNNDSLLKSNNLDRNDIALALDDEAKKIWQTHNSADADFAARSNETQIIVRNAQRVGFGSDDWSLAHVEISKLNRARAPSLQSLSALDKIIFAQLENKLTNQHIDRLLQLQKFIQSDVEIQSQFLDNLSKSLAHR